MNLKCLWFGHKWKYTWGSSYTDFPVDEKGEILPPVERNIICSRCGKRRQ